MDEYPSNRTINGHCYTEDVNGSASTSAKQIAALLT
jgi:hypothetical protein